MLKNKIEIWSTYPPPFGGVSVHSMRLFENLKDKKADIIFKNFNGVIHNPENKIFKVKNFGKEFLKLIYSRKRIIHLHSNNIYLWILFTLFVWHHKVILTIHNQKLKNKYNIIIRYLIKAFLDKVKYIIINDKDLAIYIQEKYKVNNTKFFVLPAFIPPLRNEEVGLDKVFYDFRRRYHFIITTCAWKLYRKSNIDIYGIDQIIEALHLLKQKKIVLGLVLIIPEIDDYKYFLELQEKICKYNLKDQILYIDYSIPNAFEVWKLYDVHIRATSTDIEGLAIKEALFYGVPVIASDVVIRPKEVLLYKYGNIDDLAEKILLVVNKQNQKVHFINTEIVEKIYSLYVK